MASRQAVLCGVAVAAGAALVLGACGNPDQQADPDTDRLAAEVAQASATTAAPPPCPLDIAESKVTTSKAVEIPGTAAPGLTVTVVASSPEPVPVPVDADGSFTYKASGYPKGTTADAVVVRVEGPSCSPVERGVDIVRRSAPTTTRARAKTAPKADTDPYCDILGRPAPESECDDAGARAEADFEGKISEQCRNTPDPTACYREKAHMSG